MRRIMLLVALAALVSLGVVAAEARTIAGCRIAPKASCAGAKLKGAKLRGANLREANLRGADLRGADLRSADLRRADLRKADLRRADLRGARLDGARTTGARLDGARLDAQPASTQSSSSSPAATASPAASLPDPVVLILPFADAADIARVGPKTTAAYAADHGAPFFEHNGIDFMPSRDLVPYRAMSAGIVLRIDPFQGSHEQVNVQVDAGGGWVIIYGFEPFGATSAAQIAQLDIRVGQQLAAGDALGRLIKSADGAHLHVHMQRMDGSGGPICFPDRWSDADRATVLAKATSYTQLCHG